MENWKVQSAAGAGLALNIATNHDCAVMFCHDSVFALAGIYATLQADAFGADLVATYVGHASALTHEMPLPNPERLMAESAAVHWAKVSPQAKLGKISEFMARHFVEEYGADPDSVVPAVNGVDPLQLRFRQRDQNEIRETLLQYGIPVDRSLAVSFGRSVPYKRHDVFLKAASRLEDRAHPVLMTFPRYEELHELKADLGSDATLLTSFDVELMDSLLQWEKTQLAALLAFNEPCGIIPMEARLLAREAGPVLLVSDSGGLAEQVADGVDGFICRQDDPDDATRAMGEALDLSARRRREMRVAGLQKVLGNYTWSSNILYTLAACVPRVDAVAEDVRAAMDETERGFLADTSGSTKVEVS